MNSYNFIIFASTVLLLSFLPGPDNIYVMALAAKEGFKRAFLVILGLMTGLLLHTLLYALGVTTLILAHATLLIIIKLMGAIYLLYLAYQLFVSTYHINTQPITPMSGMLLYGRGIIMNITNAKVLIFFVAFFVQFLTPTSTFYEVVGLGLIFVVIALLVFSMLAFMAASLLAHANRFERLSNGFSKLAALFFIFIALEIFVDII